ncbi:MAG TPA: ClbS/DfsB family four-helix bundle protein [Anaerolineales bacterium]|nr:ClbS/DfsB family four-helix bundle protein [Anaerolineales bacterium]
MNKSKLRESIQNGYHLFKELLAEFDAEQMQRPGAVGKWSVKDIVAHIVVHEQRMIQWMNERLCGKHPVMFQPYAMPDDKLEQLNEEIYFGNLNRPLDDILRDLDKTHLEALRLVETSTEEDLLDPARFQLLGGEQLWEAIAANTFEHYEEHGRDIQTSQVLRNL